MAKADPAGSGKRTTPRRSPAREERRRDPERSRARLLAAALDEFSEKGFAGARVVDIAARAGLNKQLIPYYFGGKEGLYRALEQQWLESEVELAPDEAPLEELTRAHLQAVLEDARHSRLLLWEGLTGSASRADDPSVSQQDPAVADMRRRQQRGELAEDLDVAMVLVALMGATLAPVSIPQVVRRSTGLDPWDPLFKVRYAELLQRIVRLLAAPEG